MRRTIHSLLVMLGVAGTIVVAAPAAQAASSCTEFPPTVSKPKWSQMVYLPGGTPIGQLVMYREDVTDGIASACFFHLGPAKDVRATTYVQIRLCEETFDDVLSCTTTGTIATDGPDDFLQYAGRIGKTGSNNRCSAAYGYIIWQGHKYDAASGRQMCPWDLPATR